MKWSGEVASGFAESGGDVGFAGQAQGADGEVPEACHDAGSVVGACLGGVFTVGDVADVVQFVLCDTRSRMRVNSQIGGRVMPDA